MERTNRVLDRCAIETVVTIHLQVHAPATDFFIKDFNEGLGQRVLRFVCVERGRRAIAKKRQQKVLAVFEPDAGIHSVETFQHQSRC